MNGPADQSWAGLHVIAPPNWRATPSATARCRCGHASRARGRELVQVLIEDYTAHRAACTGQPETPEITRSAA